MVGVNMKAIIEYDIGGDDEEAFNLMIQSRDMHLAVWRFLENEELRNRLDKKLLITKNIAAGAFDFNVLLDELIMEIKQYFHEIMDNLNISLDILS